MITIATLLQEQIEETQLLSDIEYALRSIKACGGARYCTGIHAAQLARGLAIAADLDGCTIDTIKGRCYSGFGGTYSDGALLIALRESKALLAEMLKETKGTIKQLGTLAQRRLALTDELTLTAAASHEYGLAA